MRHRIGTMQQLDSPAAGTELDGRKLAEDLHHLLGLLRRKWHFVATSILICLTVAAFYLAKTKPIYLSSSRLLVLQQGGRGVHLGSGGDPGQMGGGQQDYLSTQTFIIRSPLVVDRAVSSTGLGGLSSESVI